MKDVIIIGAGAAGLICAGELKDKNVLMFDKNEKLGRKLRITGKGRCNLCNSCSSADVISNIPRNGRFMYSALNSYDPSFIMNYFEDLGVKLKVERGNRVFPVSDDANEVADALAKNASHAEIIKEAVSEILTENSVVTGVRVGSKIYKAKNVIVATGGASYKATGSTGDGYKFAEKLGLSVVEPRPSLVALCSSDSSCSEAQGLSLKNCGLSLFENNKKIYEDFGEMLFTHFGVSGPIVLSASAHMRKKADYHIELDIKQALSFEQLDNRLLRDFKEFSNKNFENYLSELLPKKLIPIIIKRCEIDAETKCHSITREQRHVLINSLKHFKVKISGFRSLNEAIITSGGVNVKEINPKTMQSKKIEGLYFIGEVLDIDAYTGGFNLQIAFSTALVAAENILGATLT